MRDGIDGVLFDEADPEALVNAVETAERRAWDPAALKESARRFDEPRFKERVAAIVGAAPYKEEGAAHA